jgi:hypothetical protein
MVILPLRSPFPLPAVVVVVVMLLARMEKQEGLVEVAEGSMRALAVLVWPVKETTVAREALLPLLPKAPVVAVARRQ